MKSGKKILLASVLTIAFAVLAAVPAFAEAPNLSNGEIGVQQIPTILPPL